MSRHSVEDILPGDPERDYVRILKLSKLHDLRVPAEEMVEDEDVFESTHWTNEIQLGQAARALDQLEPRFRAADTGRCMTLVRRARRNLTRATSTLDLFDDISPANYHRLREKLGRGTGSHSPGHRALVTAAHRLWSAYATGYLIPDGITIEQIYDTAYTHDMRYVLAEELCSLNQSYRLWLQRHILVLKRTVGEGAVSLKGRTTDRLDTRAFDRDWFPAITAVRGAMTNAWTETHRPDLHRGDTHARP
ncbi:hypothetical protein [Amycolatopsis sp. CA-230715]|uniref:hypothetical protein n=1 Tax=Amycolatopsis sp. CA-230715 TaxID=2745196 RepID=UPI001C032530|nr:hypothetical protein [Amycolatopsis sp. CA-230715]QWF85786.1 Tryptophan 2,3-dioxygenase [Amycolatopsis sp. CA-230715]